MITIFTSVYNRAYIIENLYLSLLRQSNYNFEWLIVDDGSTDSVSELVNSWMRKKAPFEIRVFRQANGGKHRAINRGVCMARGDAFFIVDSDDYLKDDAVDIILEYLEPLKFRKEFAGISGLKVYSDDTVIGGSPNFQYFVDATNLERKEYGLCGDKAEVYKTDILKKFPFPEFEGETFITESIVWNKIAYYGYKIRWFNKGIMVCEYLRDGLTAKGIKLFVQNPKGWAITIAEAKKYKYWTEKEVDDSQLLFYENMKHIFSDEKICEMLHISENEMKKITERYANILSSLKGTFKTRIGKSLALYGMGRYGERLMRYLKVLEISVKYVVDRNSRESNFESVYSPDHDLPKVDSLCITLKNPSNSLYDLLKNKLPETEIWLFREYLPKEW